MLITHSFKNLKREKVLALISLLGLCVWLAYVGWSVMQNRPSQDSLSAEKVNLALRRTAHLLLQAAGDSTSRIGAVQHTAAYTWVVQLPHDFDYAQLPLLLQKSLAVHAITCKYDVAVLGCGDGTLLLGYNSADVAATSDIACLGRDFPEISPCYALQLRLFPERTDTATLPSMGWLIAVAIVLLLFGVGVLIFPPKKRLPAPVPSPEMPQHDAAWLSFGNSRFDIGTQVLVCHEATHKLTYREAKLLHLFVQHPNQILARNLILDKVWADEGIIVGRSIDVFVSRLRKLLRDDATVQLVAIHGVGYRMEVIQA
jgi:hypothetical protein